MKKIFKVPSAEIVELNTIENILQSSNTTSVEIDNTGQKINSESGVTPEARQGGFIINTSFSD